MYLLFGKLLFYFLSSFFFVVVLFCRKFDGEKKTNELVCASNFFFCVSIQICTFTWSEYDLCIIITLRIFCVLVPFPHKTTIHNLQFFVLCCSFSHIHIFDLASNINILLIFYVISIYMCVCMYQNTNKNANKLYFI